MKMIIQNLKNKAVLSDQCVRADSFLMRLQGLIGKKRLNNGEAMWFPRCNSIHMWFMRFAIDVVFVKPAHQAKSWEVSSTHAGVRPWRLLPLADFHATDTLELPAGSVEKFSIEKGDLLCIN